MELLKKPEKDLNYKTEANASIRLSKNGILYLFQECGRDWETKSFPTGIRSRNSFPTRKNFIFISRMRKGLGNEEFPDWNPQSEFISDEEKQEFQGFLADGTPVLYLYLLVKGLNEMSL